MADCCSSPDLQRVDYWLGDRLAVQVVCSSCEWRRTVRDEPNPFRDGEKPSVGQVH